MIEELDLVVLTRSGLDQRLERGDVGTVVHRYGGGDAFEVEFVTAGGQPIALLTLTAADLRPMHAREILHARGVAES